MGYGACTASVKNPALGRDAVHRWVKRNGQEFVGFLRSQNLVEGEQAPSAQRANNLSNICIHSCLAVRY